MSSCPVSPKKVIFTRTGTAVQYLHVDYFAVQVHIAWQRSQLLIPAEDSDPDDKHLLLGHTGSEWDRGTETEADRQTTHHSPFFAAGAENGHVVQIVPDYRREGQGSSGVKCHFQLLQFRCAGVCPCTHVSDKRSFSVALRPQRA